MLPPLWKGAVVYDFWQGIFTVVFSMEIQTETRVAIFRRASCSWVRVSWGHCEQHIARSAFCTSWASLCVAVMCLACEAILVHKQMRYSRILFVDKSCGAASIAIVVVLCCAPLQLDLECATLFGSRFGQPLWQRMLFEEEPSHCDFEFAIVFSTAESTTIAKRSGTRFC